jgi:hypothetical protein
MNSPFVKARARALADRLTRAAGDDESRIRRAFFLAFSRPPDADELRIALAFLGADGASGEDGTVHRQRLAACCQGLFATAEFRNLD